MKRNIVIFLGLLLATSTLIILKPQQSKSQEAQTLDENLEEVNRELDEKLRQELEEEVDKNEQSLPNLTIRELRERGYKVKTNLAKTEEELIEIGVELDKIDNMKGRLTHITVIEE